MTCLETLPPPTLRERLLAVLETQRLVLRAPQLGDAKAVAALANDRRIAENTARIPYPYRMADAESWIGGSNADPDEETYLITLTDGTVIGACGFDMRDGPAPEIGYWLGEAFWGRGIVTDALIAVTRACRRKNSRTMTASTAPISIASRTDFTASRTRAAWS